MTTRPPNVIDPYQPTPARLHNVFLGGKDHYEPDKALAEALSRSTIRPAITESRRFTRRAVEHLAMGANSDVVSAWIPTSLWSIQVGSERENEHRPDRRVGQGGDVVSRSGHALARVWASR